MKAVRRFWRAALLLAAWTATLISTGSRSVRAEDAPTQLPAGRRPKIGLALSGGGARGAAHLGVLKVLEELHVPIDYIAGTSMGALVGGLYAAGLTTDEMERLLRDADWRELLDDRSSYAELSYRRKEEARRYQIALEAGLSGRHLILPRGFWSGEKLTLVFREWTLGVAGIDDFSRLPIPFVAVASDLATGDRVLLDHGDLSEAIRASMSISGIFTPAQIDGRRLVDGGLSDNLPVDVVRAMGADIVIAVDVGTPLIPLDPLGIPLALADSAKVTALRRATMAQLRNADLVIQPELGEFGELDFLSRLEILRRGEAAARLQRQRLAPLAVSPETYRVQVASREAIRRPIPRRVAAVEVEGTRRVDRREVADLLRIAPGDRLDLPTLERDLLRIHGLGDFRKVGFSLRDRGAEGADLEVRVWEKEWGPGYLHFGAEPGDALQGHANLTTLVGLTRTRLNTLGGEWRSELQVGTSPGVFSELYQPLDSAGRLFLAPRIQARRYEESLFDDDRRTALVALTGADVGLDLGVRLGRTAELRAGLEAGRLHPDVESGPSASAPGNVATGLFRLRLAGDTTDRPSIPRHGGRLTAELRLSRAGLGADADYSKASVSGTRYLSQGRGTWILGAGAGSGLGSTLPFYDDFQLGGLFSLGGYAAGELRGDRFLQGRVGYLRPVDGLNVGPGGILYLGGLLESGGTWAAGSDPSFRSLRHSATLLVGADTLFGPFFFGFGRAEGGRARFYLSVGREL